MTTWTKTSDDDEDDDDLKALEPDDNDDENDDDFNGFGDLKDSEALETLGDLTA